MRTRTSRKTTCFLLIISFLSLLGCKDDKDTIDLGFVKIAAEPQKGFNWSYYLNVPGSSSSATLLVLPNNTGTPDNNQAVHDEAAKDLAEFATWLAEELKSPVLVPTFPRPLTEPNIDVWKIYTHALDRETLLTEITELQRIDLQLIAMIDDAKEYLSTKGIEVEEKVFIMGFSASGMFTNRFTVLHPERVKAAAIGSPGGWPLAPVSTWQGHTLRYNVGIADLEQLTGQAPDIELFRSVPLLLYIGDQDTNDSVPFNDSYDQEDRELINNLFGSTPVSRWPKAKEIYESADCNCQFVLYPGVGHQITHEMEIDIADFFDKNR